MKHIDQRAPDGAHATETLTLTYDQRSRSRLRAKLDSGGEVGVFLERGSTLRDGDRLVADGGAIVRVVAARETLSVVRSGDPLLLTRVAYHLGNRHVALAISSGRVAYLHDHVLDDMVRKLGVRVDVEQGPFEPEAGAYGHGGHAHGAHGHGHDHAPDDHGHGGHDHDHDDHDHPHLAHGGGHAHAHD